LGIEPLFTDILDAQEYVDYYCTKLLDDDGVKILEAPRMADAEGHA